MNECLRLRQFGETKRASYTSAQRPTTLRELDVRTVVSYSRCVGVLRLLQQVVSLPDDKSETADRVTLSAGRLLTRKLPAGGVSSCSSLRRCPLFRP